MTGAICLPLLASTTSAVAASPRTAPPVRKQLAELKGRQVPDDLFGASVAIWGSTAIVGEPTFDANGVGRAYVFTKTVKGWKRIAELKGSATGASDGFGGSVAISGTTAVVGAWGSDDVGGVYIFSEKKGAWKQTAQLKDPVSGDNALGDHFGSSVAISGAVVVVGAPGDDLFNGAGRAYVFTETKGAWKRTAVVHGSHAFGWSVAISGTTAMVGSPGCEGCTKNGGRTYVFTETKGTWKQRADLAASDAVAGGGFGSSVAVSGTTVLVGAPEYPNIAGSVGPTSVAISGATGVAGAPNYLCKAYVFGKSATGWKQTAELMGSDSSTTYVSTTTYLFTKTANSWKQTTALKGSDTVAGDEFGSAVAVSGALAVVGAPDHATGAGRAYVFRA